MDKKIWLSAKKYFWVCARYTKTEKIISYIYQFILDIFIYRKRKIWFGVESVKQHCTENHETMIEIEPEKNRPVYASPFFELSSGKEYQFLSPSIYVAIMHDVTVLGATGLVLTENNVLCDVMKQDKEHRINFIYGPITKGESDKVQLKVRSKIKTINEAINLCGLASFNYYHFTIEILSRLKYVKHIPEAGSIPILIDEEIRVYPQLEELLHIVAGSDREIIYVPSGTRVKVHLLIQPSMNTWMPINVEGEKRFRLSDNLIAKSGIMNIRSCVSHYMKNQMSRKIYISRKNCHVIRLSNEAELIPIFEEAGFDIVYTESLSYVEQVELFSSSKCVVAPTGAALTNVIYCQPGTVVGCIIPQEYNFCVYSTLAYLVESKPLFLDPEVVSRGDTIGEDYYRIEEEKCRRYIQKLVEMCV